MEKFEGGKTLKMKRIYMVTIEEIDQISIAIDSNIYNDEILIEDCRKFYVAYREYLKQQSRYNNFEDYLNQNDIPCERYCGTYCYDKDNQ